jgi:RNA polymerase sigma factor (sigma-70 family)
MDASDARALYTACQSTDLRQRDPAFRQLGRLLYPIAWRRVQGDPRLHHLAEDCTQETLVTVWRHLEAGRGPDRPESFFSWSATIVVNKVREELRRLNPTPEVRRSKRIALCRLVSLDAPPAEGEPALAETTPDDAPSAEEVAAYHEIRDLVREIGTIQDISESSRTVLMKGFIEGCDDAELAEHLQTSKTNVHVIRCRDLAKLRAAPGFVERLRQYYAD